MSKGLTATGRMMPARTGCCRPPPGRTRVAPRCSRSHRACSARSSADRPAPAAQADMVGRVRSVLVRQQAVTPGRRVRGPWLLGAGVAAFALAVALYVVYAEIHPYK